MKRMDEGGDDGARQTLGLAGLALVLLLALVASYLIQALQKEAKIEDCLLAQHRNCDALVDAR